MGRRSRRATARGAPLGARLLGTSGAEADRVEEFGTAAYYVRSLRGSATAKAYRCPGCQQEVLAGAPHMLVWPADTADGLELRRHWHTPCWAARERRTPTSRR